MIPSLKPSRAVAPLNTRLKVIGPSLGCFVVACATPALILDGKAHLVIFGAQAWVQGPLAVFIGQFSWLANLLWLLAALLVMLSRFKGAAIVSVVAFAGRQSRVGPVRARHPRRRRRRHQALPVVVSRGFLSLAAELPDPGRTRLRRSQPRRRDHKPMGLSPPVRRVSRECENVQRWAGVRLPWRGSGNHRVSSNSSEPDCPARAARRAADPYPRGDPGLGGATPRGSSCATPKVKTPALGVEGHDPGVKRRDPGGSKASPDPLGQVPTLSATPGSRVPTRGSRVPTLSGPRQEFRPVGQGF